MSDIRVLLVDDQALVRAGFRTILDSEPGIEVVGEGASGEEAVALARSLAPDVICMDVQMPGMDGLEATRVITTDPAIGSAVLVLTTFNREDYLFTALRAGASGFLLKNASPEDLIEAVQVIARGDALLSPAVTRRVIEAFGSGLIDAAAGGRGGAAASTTPDRPGIPDRVPEGTTLDPARAPAPAGRPVTPIDPLGALDPLDPLDALSRLGPLDALDALTDREAEVLVLLAEGLSNAEIAARIFVGEATVKSHVSKVLMKLGLRDRVHAVVYAYENGVVRPTS